MKFFRWILARYHMLPQTDTNGDRRKVSPATRERWAEFSREKADVERRLELVDMQAKVIEHVTQPGRE